MTDAASLFTPQYQTSMVALTYRDPRHAQTVLPFMRPEQFGSIHNGHYLKDAVLWRKHWQDTYPSEPHLPRTVFDQWAHQWVDGQPAGQREYHRAAWARLAYDLYDVDMFGTEEIKSTTMEWIQRREEQVLLAEAKRHIDSGSGLGDFDLLDRVRSIDALPMQSADIGLMLGFDPANESHEAMVTTPRHVIPLGRHEIDLVNSGGMGRKELWVVAAPPNTGKTTTLCSWAADMVRQGYFVAYYSLEHDAKQCRDKILASFSGMAPDQLRSNPEIMRHYHDVLHANNGRMIIQEWSPNKCSVQTMEAHLHLINAQCGRYPDAVVIDYADNMDLGEHKELRHGLSRMYLDIRGMAQELDLLVLTATQTNRTAVGSELITIDQLAECFDKAAIADGIIALCQLQEEAASGILRLFWAKNRHGEKNKVVPCRVNPILALLEVQDKVHYDFDPSGQKQALATTPEQQGFQNMAFAQMGRAL